MERDTYICIKEDICHWQLKTWSGATPHWEDMDWDERETFFQVIEDIYPEGIDATTLNDILWFDWEWVCEVIGRNEEEEEDD